MGKEMYIIKVDNDLFFLLLFIVFLLLRKYIFSKLLPLKPNSAFRGASWTWFLRTSPRCMLSSFLFLISFSPPLQGVCNPGRGCGLWRTLNPQCSGKVTSPLSFPPSPCHLCRLCPHLGFCPLTSSPARWATVGALISGARATQTSSASARTHYIKTAFRP